ncbi:hypothetical protein [Pseudomonas putida]
MDGAQRGEAWLRAYSASRCRRTVESRPPEKATCQVGALSQGVRLII